MACTIVVLMVLFLDAVLVANLHSAEPVTEQYYSHIEVGEMKAKFSSSESRYAISGVYLLGREIRTRQTFDWTAEGRYNRSTKATEEKFNLSHRTGTLPPASFTSKMVCNRDPWRDASAAPCQSIQTQTSGTPPGAFPLDLRATRIGIPFSSDLSKSQRAELNRQYEIFLASRQKPKPGELPPLPITAPTIVSPAPNGSMVYRKSKFVIKPAPNFDGDEILVHFTPLDRKPGYLEETIVWRIATSIVAEGADMPEEIFGKRTGPWKMRARMNAPTEGTFSPEIHFQYVLQSPAMSPKSKAPVERQGGR